MSKQLQQVVALVMVNSRQEFLLGLKSSNDYDYVEEWEFPGGKVEPGETQHQALVREIQEELDAEVTISDYLGSEVSSLHLVEIHFYLSAYRGQKLTPKIHRQIAWFHWRELSCMNLSRINLSLGDAAFIQRNKLLLEELLKKL